MTTKKIFRNPYVVGVIFLLIPTIWDFLTEVKIWLTILNSIWKGLSWFFTSNLTIWLAIGVLYMLVFLKIRKQTTRNTPEETNIDTIAKHTPSLQPTPKPKSKSPPDYLNYKEDTFDGLRRKWKWKPTPGKGYNIVDLIIICRECGAQLRELRDYPMGYGCINQDCDLFISHHEEPRSRDHVQRVKKGEPEESIVATIRSRIKTGKYKERIENTKQN